MNSRMLLAVTALIIAPSMVSAQGAEAGAHAQTRTQVQTPDARIEAALAAAARANVPESLIRSKVTEGEAKRVPRERIAAAVEARVSALVRASETLRNADIMTSTAGELSVAADALEAGVSQSALIEISRTAPSERRTVAVAVLADLIRLGHGSERAYTRVNAALASSAALASLHAEVATQLRRGGLNSTLNAAGGVGRRGGH